MYRKTHPNMKNMFTPPSDTLVILSFLWYLLPVLKLDPALILWRPKPNRRRGQRFYDTCLAIAAKRFKGPPNSTHGFTGSTPKVKACKINTTNLGLGFTIETHSWPSPQKKMCIYIRGRRQIPGTGLIAPELNSQIFSPRKRPTAGLGPRDQTLAGRLEVSL